MTALLFSFGKWGLAMYLGRASTSSAYGAAGSFVIVLMWIYYASVIVFLGAELTQVVTRAYAGVKVQPTENAVPARTVTVPDQPRPTKPAPRSQKSPRAARKERPLVTTVVSLAILWVIGLIRRRRGLPA